MLPKSYHNFVGNSQPTLKIPLYYLYGTNKRIMAQSLEAQFARLDVSGSGESEASVAECQLRNLLNPDTVQYIKGKIYKFSKSFKPV